MYIATNNGNQRSTTPKTSYIQVTSPMIQQRNTNQSRSPIIPQPKEVIRVIQPIPQEQINGFSMSELKTFLEDLMNRYDKLAVELQKATQKEIQLQNQFNQAQSDYNQKLLSFQQERDTFQQALQNKNQEIDYLNSQIQQLKEEQNQQFETLKQDGNQVAIILTEKLEQMNQFAKEKVLELDQAKSLLILREQEVQEWRNRKSGGDILTQENNQLKQKIHLLQQEKEQLMDRLRYQTSYQQQSSETQMLQAQIQELQQENNTLKMKFQLNNQTDQGLIQELQQAQKELQYYKNSQINNNNNEELEDYKDKVQILENEIQRQNIQLSEMRHELEEFKNHKTENLWLKDKLSSQQHQIRDLTAKSQLIQANNQYY